MADVHFAECYWHLHTRHFPCRKNDPRILAFASYRCTTKSQTQIIVDATIGRFLTILGLLLVAPSLLTALTLRAL